MYSLLRNLIILIAIDTSSAAEFEKMKALTYNTALSESLTTGLPITREDRRNKIIEELQTTGAGLVCLQEVFFGDDVEAIVNAVSGNYPYSFSKIHNGDGTVDGSPGPNDVPVCSSVLFGAMFACFEANCGTFTDVESSIYQCAAVFCLNEFTTVLKSSSQECLSCFLASITPSTEGFLASCAGVGDAQVLKKMNAPGLLVLSKKNLRKNLYADFFPETVELYTRGYLKVQVDRKIQAVCTHLSSSSDIYFEVNLMDRFNSYAEQHLYEINRLITKFGSKDKVLLLGSFNVGPSAPGGVIAVNPASYNTLTATFNTTAANGCTFCPMPTNPFNTIEQNELIDHIFGRGVEVKKVKRVFTTAESTLVLNNIQIPYSDRFGVQAKIIWQIL